MDLDGMPLLCYCMVDGECWNHLWIANVRNNDAKMVAIKFLFDYVPLMGDGKCNIAILKRTEEKLDIHSRTMVHSNVSSTVAFCNTEKGKRHLLSDLWRI